MKNPKAALVDEVKETLSLDILRQTESFIRGMKAQESLTLAHHRHTTINGKNTKPERGIHGR